MGIEIEYTKENKIAIFTINRPQHLNALNVQAFHELYDYLNEFRDDDNQLVGIITGKGDKAFCAGVEHMPCVFHKRWIIFLRHDVSVADN